MAELLPERVHCCEYYDKERYLGALEALHHDGAKFVIFQNQERILVLDGDRTYLNILCEGLLQLLTNLKLDYPDERVKLNVVIATRKNVSAGMGYIRPEEYFPRLKEKLELAKYRSHADICDYELHFADARHSKRHDLADIVCNTYLTQNGKKKFTDADRKRIADLYDKKYVYSVFESATVAYLKQLLSENRYSEMIYQFCALPNLQGVADLHEKLLERLNKASNLERNTYFQEISLQIGLYITNRMFTNGIQFARNYQSYFLRRL